MKDKPSLIEFVKDPALLGLEVSPAQETLLRVFDGLSLDADQLEIFKRCTGRKSYPGKPFPELTVLAGARAGKDSRIACPIAVYEAVFGGHEKHLARGEVGVISLVAQDLRASAIAYRYIREFFEGSKLLNSLVDDIKAGELHLKNRIHVVCFPSTTASLRGWSIPCGIMDELAFFRLAGSIDSDAAILTSIRRGQINFPNARLVKISTPYLRSGVLFEDYRRFWGRDSEDILIWKAPSRLMNPSLTEKKLEREKRLDPERYKREFEAEFLEGSDAFLPERWIEDSVISGRYQLPPVAGTEYVAAVDPSSGVDTFTLAISHAQKVPDGRTVAVLDHLKGWRRGRGQKIDLEGIVGEIARTLREYGVREVHGDSYGSLWIREKFTEERGIRYEIVGDKSSAYLELEPLLASGLVELLDHPELLRELKNLERIPRPGGRTRIDHPRGLNDDFANVAALALTRAAEGTKVRFQKLKLGVF